MTHVEYRLVGCPGGGKTTTLATTWIPRAAERWGPSSVAVCSLTKAAAAEVASRDSGIPKEQVGTLHALCYRAIGRPPVAESKIKEWNEHVRASGLSGFELSGEERSSVDEPDLETRLSGCRGDKLMARAQVFRHRLVAPSPETWPEDVLGFHRRWSSWCTSNGYVDFTGMIEMALAGIPHAPGSPRVLVCDEVQDQSALELTLVRKWAASCEHVVLAGDPMQAIYGWRGADPEAFVGHAIPPENERFISRSHRCPRAVRDAAVRWAGRMSTKLPLSFEPRDAAGRVSRSSAFLNYGDSVLPLLEGDGAVMLLASCGFHVAQLVAALRREGVPFHNPYRRSNGAWNPLRGGGKRLADFLRPDPRTYGTTEARLWSWSELKAWTDAVESAKTLTKGAKELISARAKAESDPEVRQARPDVHELRKLFTEQAWRGVTSSLELGTDESVRWFSAQLLGSWKSKFEYALKVCEKRGARALISEPRVVVGTIHSTKGSTTDRCVVFPDLSPAGMGEWEGGARSRDALVRLFYVAMTRAREELVLCAPSSGNCADWGAVA